VSYPVRTALLLAFSLGIVASAAWAGAAGPGDPFGNVAAAYLVKVDGREVWARNGPSEDEPATLAYGLWTIDFAKFVATHRDGREQPLTATEAAMLRHFARRPGEVISREAFLRDVWGRTGALETRTVDNFVRKLRRALEPDPSKPRHIVSVRAAGYKFVP